MVKRLEREIEFFSQSESEFDDAHKRAHHDNRLGDHVP
jgi:hypothetical protein